MFIYGYHPVREALRRQASEVRKVMVASARGGSRRREIERLCQRLGIPLEGLHGDRLEGRVHNGFAAELVGDRAKAGRRSAGGQSAERRSDPELQVLVEDVQDPRNLGALLRVAEGAGVGRLMVRDRGSAPLNAAAIKTSAGASEWLPVERITNSAQVIERLQQDGYWVYGLAAGGKAPWEVDLRGKAVLCFGGEEKGLRARTRNLCDDILGLPMRGRVESLNLATAAAAVLYEAVRQRLGEEPKP
ncbi:MAG: RNA methyltransferase [Acidobacteriota bacterium]